jgi:hypothetical protein
MSQVTGKGKTETGVSGFRSLLETSLCNFGTLILESSPFPSQTNEETGTGNQQTCVQIMTLSTAWWCALVVPAT